MKTISQLDDLDGKLIYLKKNIYISNIYNYIYNYIYIYLFKYFTCLVKSEHEENDVHRMGDLRQLPGNPR